MRRLFGSVSIRSVWRRLSGFACWAAAFGAVALISAACDRDQSALDPKTPQAEDVATVWWIMLGLGVLTFIIVMVFLTLALFRRRLAGEVDRSASGPVAVVLLFGAAFPALVILFLMGMMLDILDDEAGGEDELVIQVNGRQWWWEVTYPQYGFETANEIHVPLNRPVRIELTSSDVIHSFWVPQMFGKVDAIPGQVNTFTVEVTEAGTFSGQCAEFCGLQHANMGLFVIGDEDFDTWVREQQQPAQPLDDPALVQGREIFFGSSCVYCHAIRGTQASGDVGPDLTHLASRRTIGAGVLVNNVGTLTGWVLNPHRAKPGNLMPASDLTGEELQALVEFLNSLE